MKRFIYLILFLTNSSIYLTAQHCSEITNTQPGTTINVFDWTQEYYDFVIGTPGSPTFESVQSPFFDGNPSNDNIYHINNVTPKDFDDNNGWELVQNHFGTSSDPVSTPYLVLYNRYEGVLRVFVWIQQSLEGYTKAELTFKFFSDEQYQTAALNLINNPNTALNAWLRDNEMHTPNSYINQVGGFWLFADYPITYDPCTCNYSSTLQVLADLIDVSTITLQMEGGGTIEQILGGGNSTPSFGKLVDGAIKNGTKVSKSITGYKNTAEEIYDNYKLKLAQEDGTIKNYNDLTPAEQAKEDEKFKKNVSLPGWVKSIPKIGFAFGLIEHLIGGGKTTPPTPISFEANLEFDISGTNEDSDPHGSIDFYTPGSVWGANNERQPVYNNILGVFNILKSPEFEIAEDDDEGSAFLGEPWFAYYGVTYESRSFLLQMTDELEYVFNPASGLTLVDIKAAIVLEDDDDSPGTIHVELRNSPEYPDEFDPSYMFFLEADDFKRWQTPFFPLQCLQDIVINLGPQPTLIAFPSDYLEKVHLKLLVTLERDSADPFYDPDAEQVIVMMEYPANVTEVSTGSIIPTNTYGQIRLSETVSDLSLTEDQTIYAWSTIEVGEDIVTNGNQLTLIAGGEIIGNIADLSANVDLIIGYPPLCDGPPPAAVTGTDLNTYCTNGAYTPAGQQIIDGPDERNLSHSDDSNSNTIRIAASPNPFIDYFELQYSNQETDLAEVIIIDGMGRTIEMFELNLQKGDNQKLEIATSDWTSGIYMLTFKTETFIETIKMIKH